MTGPKPTFKRYHGQSWAVWIVIGVVIALVCVTLLARTPL